MGWTGVRREPGMTDREFLRARVSRHPHPDRTHPGLRQAGRGRGPADRGGRVTAWPAARGGLDVCPVRGLPIPASSGRDPATGAGKFGVNDPLAKLVCGMGRRCGVCGGPLGAEVVFLAADRGGDPARLDFSDPGMDGPCAKAAMDACPHIARGRPGKPGWVWVTAAGYQLVPGQGGALVGFRPDPPPLAILRFGYEAGRLVER